MTFLSLPDDARVLYVGEPAAAVGPRQKAIPASNQ
jgi:hypothetical protein